MYWEATDLSGNKDTCQVKVIVNDYWNIPEIICPEDVLQTTDDWRCDAVVYNIGADISSVCQDNLSLTYEIFADEALTDRIRCGVGDASGGGEVGDAARVGGRRSAAHICCQWTIALSAVWRM